MTPYHGHLVVVGFNGSRRSDRALAYAAGHAARTGADLLLVLAGEDPAPWPTHAVPRERRIRRLHAQAESLLLGLEVHWQLLVSAAGPRSALRQSARRYQADLIVVGASAPHWHRLLTDRVGAALARSAPSPILVVP
ncbi:universal stress protein [Kitasatospora sp. LaBMicrA B282]|uniref:universal stress protein n=1 Tax=Kitasatospora sp. LaBMicrA B282 TaxID=3420949 RepID=UPI003D0E5F76